MRKLLSLAIVGAAARWLFDPAQGEGRRAALIGRLRGARSGIAGGMDGARDAAGAAVGHVRDAAAGAVGHVSDAGDAIVAGASDVLASAGANDEAAADVTSPRGGNVEADDDVASPAGLSDDAATYAGDADDQILHDRVESELYRDRDVPKGDININVEFGKVVLRGEVESRELIDDLVVRVRAIEGVSDVESLLHTPGEPAPMHE